MYYPLFFKPVYKEVIWGGRNLERLFGREIPCEKVAESWEVCCHKNGMSITEEGAFQGKTLEQLMQEDKPGLLGAKALEADRFPLLVKFLDANDKLSVQVHPDNNYSLSVEGDLGKSEIWYILDAKPDAQIIYGTKPGIDKELFRSALLDGHLEDCLNYVNIRKGDFFFIPAGTVHAILDGIIIDEIQQNSDTTYRVYDWNRVDKEGNSRELHINKALDVINFDFKFETNKPIIHNFDYYTSTNLVTCEFFTVDKIDVHGMYSDKTNGSTFHIYSVVEGEGTLQCSGELYPLQAGRTFMIPACGIGYEIRGKCVLIKSYL